MPSIVTVIGDRTEYGHRWQATPVLGRLRPHWRSTSGNIVRIFPPGELEASADWIVMVCDSEDKLPTEWPDLMHFSGENTEERAFCVAAGYTRQVRSRL